MQLVLHELAVSAQEVFIQHKWSLIRTEEPLCERVFVSCPETGALESKDSTSPIKD